MFPRSTMGVGRLARTRRGGSIGCMEQGLLDGQLTGQWWRCFAEMSGENEDLGQRLKG